MTKETELNYGLLDKRDSRQPSILKAGRNLLIGLTLGVAAGAAIFIGAVRSFNTLEYISDTYSRVQKPAGLLDAVEMTKAGRGNNLTRTFEYTRQTGIFSDVEYLDTAEDPNSLDGITDELTILSHHRAINIKRENGYSDFKEEFDRGDKILAEQEAKYADFFN